MTREANTAMNAEIRREAVSDRTKNNICDGASFARKDFETLGGK